MAYLNRLSKESWLFGAVVPVLTSWDNIRLVQVCEILRLKGERVSLIFHCQKCNALSSLFAGEAGIQNQRLELDK